MTEPLYGIPYGLKEIAAVPGFKTAWGSRGFKGQLPNVEAWVYMMLQTHVQVFLLQLECINVTILFNLSYAKYSWRSAGAVLVAKLVSGSLTYDDI